MGDMRRGRRKGEKLVIPRVAIRRLYEYARGRRRGDGRYRRALSILLPGSDARGMSFPEFRRRVAHNLLSAGVGDALRILSSRGISLNPSALRWALSRVGVEASETTCRNVISLLRGAGVLEFSMVPVVVGDDGERVLHYVRRLGCVRYSRLESLVPGAREIVLDLISKGKLLARYRGRVLDSLDGGDWDDYRSPGVPPEFLQEWEDDEGRMRRKITLPGSANVCAKFD